MDILAYRIGAPRIVAWPGRGRPVGLRPLSSSALYHAKACDDATDAALYTLAMALCSVEPPYERLTTMGALARALSPDVVKHLLRMWTDRQEEDVPASMPEFETAMRLAMLSDGRVIADGMVASCSDDMAAFYGVSYVDLTHGQVLYWLSCRAMYRDLHENAGQAGYTRAISREVLEQWPS